MIDRLLSWAEVAADRPDAKTEKLIEWIANIVKPGGTWSNERVIIFTEYRDTQKYLVDQLTAAGLAKGDRLKTLFGGQDDDEREAIKAAFQADPDLDPVRILLATDTASEGIDLQRQCHRLVHVEIPWNPNRLSSATAVSTGTGSATQQLTSSTSLAPATKRPSQAASKRTLSSCSRGENRSHSQRHRLGWPGDCGPGRGGNAGWPLSVR